MARLEILQKLTQRSQQKLDQVGRELADLKRQCQLSEDKLTMLQKFEQDYQQRLNQRGTQGIAGATLREYQQFLKQLEQVIDLQTKEVERHRRFCEEAMQRWLLARRDTKAFGVLEEQQLAIRHLADIRLAQKQMDEFSSRARDELRKMA